MARLNYLPKTCEKNILKMVQKSFSKIKHFIAKLEYFLARKNTSTI